MSNGNCTRTSSSCICGIFVRFSETVSAEITVVPVRTSCFILPLSAVMDEGLINYDI